MNTLGREEYCQLSITNNVSSNQFLKQSFHRIIMMIALKPDSPLVPLAVVLFLFFTAAARASRASCRASRVSLTHFCMGLRAAGRARDSWTSPEATWCCRKLRKHGNRLPSRAAGSVSPIPRDKVRVYRFKLKRPSVFVSVRGKIIVKSAEYADVLQQKRDGNFFDSEEF